MEQLDPQTDHMDQGEKNVMRFLHPTNTSLGTITLSEHESSEFQEGGIRAWTTMTGA